MNYSYNSTDEPFASRALVMTLYSAIFSVSLTGNTLVCLVVCRQQKMRTSTNYYIVNLACADLAITVLCIPFDIAIQKNSYVWPFGAFMCKVLYPIMTMSAFASVGTLTAIALNRYIAVMKAMRVYGAKKRAKLAISLIWAFSFSAVLPYALALEVDQNAKCVETWSSSYSQCYTLFIFVFQYVIPLSVITAAYVAIGLQLRRNRANLAAAHRRQDRDVAKVVRMMTIVVLIFAVCMLPNHMLWIFRDFSSSFDDSLRETLQHWGEILIYANSSSNPIVYSICIEEFRMAFKAYITKCCRVSEEDVRPINRMFERISFRGRSFSSDRLGRQAMRLANRRLDKERALRHTLSQTTFHESELPNRYLQRMHKSVLNDRLAKKTGKRPDTEVDSKRSNCSHATFNRDSLKITRV